MSDKYFCDQCGKPWSEYIPNKCKCYHSNPVLRPIHPMLYYFLLIFGILSFVAGICALIIFN